MQFLLSTDSHYAMPTGVLIQSIQDNNPSAHQYYIMVSPGFDDRDKCMLYEIVQPFGSTISFLEIPSSRVSSLPMGNDGQPEYISVATYYRLFLQSIIPESVERLIYLDGDIICRGSLSDLWNFDIEGAPMGAVYEIENNDGRYDRLGYSQSEGYFNAGVLLINVKYWRENDAETLFMEFIKEYRNRIRYHDQDVLNSVYHGQIRPLPLCFNLLNGYLVRDSFTYRYTLEEVSQARLSPILVHYSSHLKPWYKGCSHPFAGDFVYYKQRSPWVNHNLKPFPASTLKGKLSNILVALGLKKYNGNYIQ